MEIVIFEAFSLIASFLNLCELNQHQLERRWRSQKCSGQQALGTGPCADGPRGSHAAREHSSASGIFHGWGDANFSMCQKLIYLFKYILVFIMKPVSGTRIGIINKREIIHFSPTVRIRSFSLFHFDAARRWILYRYARWEGASTRWRYLIKTNKLADILFRAERRQIQ